VVLDPFAGCGTVLHEAAVMSLAAYGFELNPAAWCFSKLYEFVNTCREERKRILDELRRCIHNEFQIILFSDDLLPADVIQTKIIRISNSISDQAKRLCNPLVVLLDIDNNPITNHLVQARFNALAKLIEQLPFSNQPVKADLQDARALPLGGESINFIITSPPYINVFNYHQNYRKSVEFLGWDLLRVARSEIGSNRANRGNRFLTVIQYCIDMAKAVQEMSRILIDGGRAVLVVGHESRVLGAPFFNADVIEAIARKSELFDVVLRQKRVFVNRFGQTIREDILNLTKICNTNDKMIACEVGRAVARDALNAAFASVSAENRMRLGEALERVNEIGGTPIFDSLNYPYYQTRECVMMIKEE
jgi:DNA modification methylase